MKKTTEKEIQTITVSARINLRFLMIKPGLTISQKMILISRKVKYSLYGGYITLHDVQLSNIDFYCELINGRSEE